MKDLSSRVVASMLFRYALLIEAEKNRQRALGEITGDDEAWSALGREAEEAQNAANYLHELKEYL